MILRRQELTSLTTVNFDNEVQKAREELYKQSEQLLGWRPQQKPRPAYELRDILRKLEIKPFTASSVEAYKALLVRRPPLGAWVRASFTALAVYGMFQFWGAANPVKDPFWRVVASLLLTATCIFLVVNTIKRYFETKRTWETCRFNQIQYRDRSDRPTLIPDFALETAVRVKQAAPFADLFVEFLQTKRNHIQLIDPDPFLVVRWGSEAYYLEVWDERDYKEERES